MPVSSSARTLAYSAAAVGATLGLGATVAAVHETRHASAQWKEGQENAQMTRILSNMQTGPFGNMSRAYGMNANYGNSAGMTLALHYARQGTGMKDPFFSLAGHFSAAGRMLGG